METGITTNLMTYVIVTSGKTHHMISEKTNKMLENASLNDLLELDSGIKIKVSSIMEIYPTLEKYYEQYPDKLSEKIEQNAISQKKKEKDPPQVRPETLRKLRELKEKMFKERKKINY
jgi:hypothetical protein